MSRPQTALRPPEVPGIDAGLLDGILQGQLCWLDQVIGLQTAWLTSLMALQTQCWRDWSSGSQQLPAWLVWHNGTEQLA